MSINDKIEINIDMTRFKGNLAKAHQNLAYQIISDTQDYVPFQQGVLSSSVHMKTTIRKLPTFVYGKTHA